MRDRLIELILNTPQKQAVIQGRATGKTYRTAENIADHLIANGVGFVDDLRAENKRLLEALELLESEQSVPADDTEIGMITNPNDRM